MARMYKRFLKLSLLILSTSLVFNALQAQTWTGNGGNNLWDDPDNWSTNSIPNNSNVIISGDSVFCNDDIAVVDIDLSSGAVLYFENTFVEIDDDIVIDATSRFTLDAGSDLVLGASTIASNGITTNGYFLNKGEILVDPSAPQGTGGIRNSGDFYNFGSITIESGFASGFSNQPTGNLYNQSGDITITCDDDFGLFSSGNVLNNAIINLSGSNTNALRIFSVSFSTINSVFTNNGSCNIDGPGVNALPSSPAMYVNDESTLNQNGQLEIQNRRIPIHSQGIINNTGTLTVLEGWEYGIDLDGDLTNSGTIDIRNIINVGIDVENGVVFENNASGIMNFTNCDEGIVLEQNFTNNGEIETINCVDGMRFITAAVHINNGVLKFDGIKGLENSEPGSITTNNATGQVFSNCNFAFGVYDTFNNLGSVELTKGNLVGFSNSSVTSYTNDVTIVLKGIAIGVNSVLDTLFNSSTGRIESESTEEIRLALNVVNEGFMSFDNPEVLFIPQTLINNSDLTISNPTLYAIDGGTNGYLENKGNLNVVGSSPSTSVIRVRGEFKNEGLVSLTNAGGIFANVFKNYDSFQSVGGGGIGVSNFFGLPNSIFENHSGATISLENTAIGGISIGNGSGFNNGVITGSTTGGINCSDFTNTGSINFGGTIFTSSSAIFVNENTGVVTTNTTNSFAISNNGNFINRGTLNAFSANNGIICGIGSNLEIDGPTHVKATAGIGIDLRANTTFEFNYGKQLTISDFGTRALTSIIPLEINGNLTIRDAENLQSGLHAFTCPNLIINGTTLVENVSAGVFVDGDFTVGDLADFRVLGCNNNGTFPTVQALDVNGQTVNNGFIRVDGTIQSAIELQSFTNDGDIQVFNVGLRALLINGTCHNKSGSNILIENAQFAVGFVGRTQNHGSIYTQNSGSIVISSGDTLFNHDEIYVESGIGDALFVNANSFFVNEQFKNFTVDATSRYGVSGAFHNKGNFDIGATGDHGLFSQNGNMKNDGNIILRFMNKSAISMSHDTLFNNLTGTITVKSASSFAINNEGYIRNEGNLVIEDCDEHAIRNFNSDGIDNYGFLRIIEGAKGGIQNTNADVTNKPGGVLLIEDVVTRAIVGGGMVTNEPCATIKVKTGLGTSNFNNQGYLSLSYIPGTFTSSSWYGGFTNLGIFVERSGITALENSYVNKGVTLFPNHGELINGQSKFNIIYTGESLSFTIDPNFYTNPAANINGGTVQQYTVIPNSGAASADSLYFKFSNGTQCDYIVPVNNTSSTNCAVSKDLTFSESLSDSWHNPYNWTPNLVPEKCDNAIIPTGKNVKVDNTYKAKAAKLSVETGAVFETVSGAVIEAIPFN